MSPVHTIGDEGSPSTVFTVLGRSARAHSRRYLATEQAVAIAIASLVVAWQPQWWPVASLAAAVFLYATWGVLASVPNGKARRGLSRVRRVIAALATLATLSGIGGLGLKAFTGSAPGPYGACYHPDGRTYACHANGSERPVSRR